VAAERSNVAGLSLLGIPSSLRRGSYSGAMLRAAGELLPPATRFEIADIQGIPIFNQDDEKNPPPGVVRLKEQVLAADALLFSLNEHNYGLSAAMKNVLDWVSRPTNAWNGKPAGILSASPGMLGGARAQMQLRQSMVFLNIFPINRPEVIVPAVHQRVDAEGRLTDATTRKFVQDHLVELARFARLFARRD
jgi:chromate reductase, NAD(P)H dehydrogenase (quinone)